MIYVSSFFVIFYSDCLFCNQLELTFYSKQKIGSYRNGTVYFFDHGFTHRNKQFFLIKLPRKNLYWRFPHESYG